MSCRARINVSRTSDAHKSIMVSCTSTLIDPGMVVYRLQRVHRALRRKESIHIRIQWLCWYVHTTIQVKRVRSSDLICLPERMCCDYQR
jgi:hypothetical protein